MSVDAPARHARAVGTGFAVALVANAVLLAGLPPGWSSAVPALGCAMTFTGGVLLMLPERTWLLGLGVVGGAVVSFALEVVVAMWSVAQVTY